MVARFTLPLRLAPLQNELMRMHWARRRKLKAETYLRLFQQGGRLRTPLPGRPMVLGIRCSTKRPDDDAGMGVKVALDVLKSDKQGLGYIVDDSPEYVDLRMIWAYAPRGKGELVLEVWEDVTEDRSVRAPSAVQGVDRARANGTSGIHVAALQHDVARVDQGSRPGRAASDSERARTAFKQATKIARKGRSA